MLLCALTLASCRDRGADAPAERSFYYWKSNYSLSPVEVKALDSLNVKTLYIKFFDVDLSPTGSAMPVAPIHFTQLPSGDTKVIPTVFITQACMNSLHGGDIDSLALHMSFLLSQIIDFTKLKNIPEIQIDCDWTARNANAFFSLLNAFKSQPVMRRRQLSATIRLYQLKFISKVGVPPVDRGMLMCYNMGDLTDPAARNSIVDVDILKQYASSMKSYPLPLDIAFPMFEWAVLFRDWKYKALLRDIDTAALGSIAVRKALTTYVVRADTIFHGYAVRTGDVIRFEDVSTDALTDATKLAADNLVHTPGRVAFFHLDSSAIAKYHVETLDRLYRRFE